MQKKDGINWYEENVVGTIDSNWQFHRTASLSSFAISVEQLGRIIDSWSEGKDKNFEPGILLMNVTVPYGLKASGPLLSSILTPIYAIESFIALCAYVYFISNELSADTLKFALHGFESQSLEYKLFSLLELINAKDSSKIIRQDVKELIDFRNSVVHDSPLVNIEHGIQIKIRGKKLKNADTSGLFYPSLSGNSVPLKLSHARKAISTHDNLVDHILSNSDTEFIEAFFEKNSASDIGKYTIAFGGGTIWNMAEKIDQTWESDVIPWCEQVPIDDQMSLLNKIKPFE